ncbi:hypothetical protein [Pleurocapsa sp. CCALA 161]|uniref:hypothetical protein n=1 Tax=Pleurocapsa sp. CCALA 161 TaxID=2107688 RepID=UPI0011B2948A|nr:hypothetical protein [Pleurocapsa sp. CCALA 161]
MFGISLDRLQQRQTAYFTLKSFWLLASWRICPKGLTSRPSRRLLGFALCCQPRHLLHLGKPQDRNGSTRPFEFASCFTWAKPKIALHSPRCTAFSFLSLMPPL